MINNIICFGKFLDQPILTAKLNKKMPYILGGLGTLYLLKETLDSFNKTKAKEQIKKDETKCSLINKAIVLTASITSAIYAPKIAGKIFKRIPLESVEKIKRNNTNIINKFLSKDYANENCKQILNKAKSKILSFKEIKELYRDTKDNKEQKRFLEKLIPNPKNITAKEIFQEIGYLSVYGAIPVVGGIAGGIAADKITNKNKIKENIPDKINEGVYQYLANIFMCNIGAGTALAMLEKMKIKSRSARALGMTAGIILTGIVGGSKAANLIAKNIISPVLNPKQKKEEIKERKPELLDIGLHTDDIATVSLLSGLKWIEPALPVLYSVSGYRAGIGYRN